MESTFHREHRYAADRTSDESTRVAGCRSLVKVGYFAIIDIGLDINLSGEATEPGPQDDAGAGSARPAGADLSRGLFHLSLQVVLTQLRPRIYLRSAVG